MFVFVGLVFHSLVFASSLLFWPKWLRVLVAVESSGLVSYLPQGLGGLGCLDSVSSSKA